MHAITKDGMLKFIQYSIDKGLVNANTGVGWRAACNKILEEFGPDDDLKNIDVPSEVMKYANRHPGVLSPDSLSQYQKRVQLVMGELAKYISNSTTYKGVMPRSANGKTVERKRQASAPAAKEALTLPAPPTSPDQAPQAKQISGAVTETSLMMPFPLRPTFVAQLVIPRDLSKDEAERLCAFIRALAHEPATES